MRAQKVFWLIAFIVCTSGYIFAGLANTVVATITVGVTPASMAITPDNRFGYVANNNNYAIAGQDTVTVIDLSTNLPKLTISDASFNEPYRIAINAAGTKAYVANSNSTTVTIIDIATNTVSGIITGFDGPSGFAIMPDQQTAYVNNYGAPGGAGSGNATTVRVVDLTTNTIVGPAITVGQAPAALAITPDGAFVYVINYVNGMPGTGTISVIRTSDNTVVDTIPGFSGPFGIAITPDGKFAYVTNFGSNNFEPFGTTVSAVDLSTNTIVATINVGIQPAGIAITPDGKYAYATNYDTLYTDTTFSTLVPGQGTVNIIDIASNTVIPPTIAVGESPDSITISPNGAFAYVTNYTYNSVNVIALPTFQIEAQACRIANRFLTQVDYVNKITWTASGTVLPGAYSILSHAQVLGAVLASEPLVFFDHNRTANNTDTYYIIGANEFGTVSAPISVSISENC